MHITAKNVKLIKYSLFIPEKYSYKDYKTLSW